MKRDRDIEIKSTEGPGIEDEHVRKPEVTSTPSSTSWVHEVSLKPEDFLASLLKQYDDAMARNDARMAEIIAMQMEELANDQAEREALEAHDAELARSLCEQFPDEYVYDVRPSALPLEQQQQSARSGIKPNLTKLFAKPVHSTSVAGQKKKSRLEPHLRDESDTVNLSSDNEGSESLSLWSSAMNLGRMMSSSSSHPPFGQDMGLGAGDAGSGTDQLGEEEARQLLNLITADSVHSVTGASPSTSGGAAVGGASRASSSSSSSSTMPPEENWRNYHEPEDLCCELYPHQKIAVQWMGRMERANVAGGGVLADEMGLGKTVTVIAHMLSNPAAPLGEPQRTLLVVPPALIRQWCSEIDTRTNQKTLPRALLYHGQLRQKFTVDDLMKLDIVVTTYDTLRWDFSMTTERPAENAKSQNPSRTASQRRGNFYADDDDENDADEAATSPPTAPIFQVPWRRVFLDEAHLVRNRKSKTHQAVFQLRADFRWCLTGTPINNSLDDFYSLLHLLRVRPFNQWRRWRAHMKTSDRALQVSRFQAIAQGVMLRRTKQSMIEGEPLISLPPKNLEVIETEFATEDERTFYEAIESKAQVEFNRYLARNTVLRNMVGVLALLLRMRRVCDHPQLVSARFAEREGRVGDDTTADGQGGGSGDSPQSVLQQFETNKLPVNPTDREKILRFAVNECPICMDRMVRPVVCPCCHSLCLECCCQLFHAHAKPACPLCRLTLKPDGIQMLSKVVNLAELGYEDETGAGSTASNPTPAGEEDSAAQEKKEVMAATAELLNSSILHSTKTQLLVNRIRRMQANDPESKGVVVTQWVGMIDILSELLAREGIESETYAGDMSMRQREEALYRFRTDPQVPILLLSLKAGGVGLNLTEANYIWVVDPWYNPQAINQAIDRVHRIGQRKAVVVERFVIKETVEQRILALERDKEAIANESLDHAAAGRAQSHRLTLDDLIFLFSNRARTNANPPAPSSTASRPQIS